MLTTPEKIEEKIEKCINIEEVEKGTSLFADSLRKFRQNRMATFSCLTITLLFLASLTAKFVTPYSFDQGDLELQNMPPTWSKLFMGKEYKAKMLKWAKKNLEDEDQDEVSDEIDESYTNSGEITLNIDETPRPAPIRMFDESIVHLSPEAVIAFFKMGNFKHLFGTDEIGQDIFSRLIYGMRLSLFLALTVTIVSVFIGVCFGSVSGYFGGFVDQIMMRIVDFLFGVPFIFLIILLMVFFGRHVFLIFVGLGLIYWIVLARIVRGQILSLKEKEFVLAAISNGVSKKSIIFKHLVPNVIGPVIVFSTLLVPQIMLLEAFLSFIGLGVSPPDVSLGIMISDGAKVLTNYSWPIIFPGIVFSLMIFCMNFIGDGLRDALDPKLK